MAQKLFIGGLSFSTSNERLREVFAQVGSEAAVKKFDGQELDGRRLTVQPAKPAGLGDRSRSSGGERRSR